MPEPGTVDVDLSGGDPAALVGWNIELPKPGPRPAGGTLTLAGWAVGRESPVEAVEVYRGDLLLARVGPAVPRPDVAAHYPDTPDAGRSGFRAAVAIPRTAGTELDVRAVLATGATARVGVVRVAAGDADPNAVVARHWGELAARPVACWLDSPLVMANVNRQVTGDPGRDWTHYVFTKYLLRGGRGVGRGLSLGCGAGAVERVVRALGACDTVDAYDLSPGALAEARRRAAEAGITGVNYAVADLNRLELPPATYDAVYASMSVHHVEALEHLYAQVRRTLKPGGVFILWEFVGPTRFQFPAKAKAIIDGVLALLPPRLRREAEAPDNVRQAVSFPTLDEMLDVDPSESVRSAEILPLLEREFDVVERRDWGGTVAHFLLNGLAQNFDPDSAEDAAILKLILYLEEVLIREGVLTSDFTLVVAAPKPDRADAVLGGPAA